MRMNVGKQIEIQAVEEYKNIGIYINNNIPFTSKVGDLTITGELDAVLRTAPGSKEKYILEKKSIYGHYSAKEVFGQFLYPRAAIAKPKWGHLFQLGIYLYHFSSLPITHPNYINLGVLHYTDRGDGHFGTFEVELIKEWKILSEGNMQIHKIAYWSEELHVPYTVTEVSIEDILSRYKQIKDKLSGDTPPPRDFEKEYSSEKIESYHDAGLISESKYDKWKSSHSPRGKGKEFIGDFHCYTLYCPWSDLCHGCQK